MLERQREGIAKAKAEKRHKGRAPTARAKADQIRLLASHGLAKREIAKQLGIGERSVFRVLAHAEPIRTNGERNSDASGEGSRVPNSNPPVLPTEPERGSWMHDVHSGWMATSKTSGTIIPRDHGDLLEVAPERISSVTRQYRFAASSFRYT
jgi:hypothetical protein